MRQQSDSFGLFLLFAAATAGFFVAPASEARPPVSASSAPMTGQQETPTPAPPERTPDPYRFAPDLLDRLADLPPTRLDYDRRSLDDRETRALKKLIEASHVIDDLFLRQVTEDNPALREKLAKLALSARPGALDAITYFDAMYGPWDRLRHDEPFIGRRAKPPGAAFYPTDMTKEEFERWNAGHPQGKEKLESLLTVVRRDGDKLVAIPYSQYYAPFLADASGKLREAAALTGNDSLKVYLTKLADALLSNDYFASDLAWMDLDSDIEFVLGPYEVYEDSLFNYKSSFEAYVTVRDRRESEKLAVYAQHLPDLERNLPIRDDQKNFNRKFESPIRVVQEAFIAGEARAGVQTSAFNLPNDERVRQAKGSKKVLLKNVIEAKFEKSGRPIAERVLDPGQKTPISFDAYFNQVLFHELSHGLGPGIITGPDGEKVETRLLLKNLYSTIEECKADVVGVWSLLYALDRKWIDSFSEASLFATDAALMFRSMRFGLQEAHGGGTAVQWNWYREKGAIVAGSQGRFRVRPEKFREAVRSLARELLEIEATGDSGRAQRLLDRYGKATPEINTMIAKLKGIPVDIRPSFPAAGEQ